MEGDIEVREGSMDAGDAQQPLGWEDDMEGVEIHMEGGTFEANYGDQMDIYPKVNLDNYEDLQEAKAEAE